jgi:hypothetical protein
MRLALRVPEAVTVIVVPEDDGFATVTPPEVIHLVK